jgi:hypothetical protein
VSFFQLTPHLQCFNPTNCCTIALPQLGHIRLLLRTTITPPYFSAFALNLTRSQAYSRYFRMMLKHRESPHLRYPTLLGFPIEIW